MEVTFNLEVSHTEPEHREFVQATSDLFGEGQQAGQTVQFYIQTVPVTFGRIGFHRRRFYTKRKETQDERTVREMLLAKTCFLSLTIYNTEEFPL